MKFSQGIKGEEQEQDFAWQLCENPALEAKGEVLSSFASANRPQRLSKLDFAPPASKAASRFLGLVPGLNDG